MIYPNRINRPVVALLHVYIVSVTITPLNTYTILITVYEK